MELGEFSVAIGASAGKTRQGTQSVAIGNNAGTNSQGANSVAIGTGAGEDNLGEYSVAIGPNANKNNDSNTIKTIVINAEDSPLDTQQSNAFYVKPIRSAPNTDSSKNGLLFYDKENYEIMYYAYHTP